MKTEQTKKIARRGLCLVLLAFGQLGHGQVIEFCADLPQVVGPFPIAFLSGKELTASFATTDLWLASIHFPATGTNPACDLEILGPVDSVYMPIDGIGGWESITYGWRFSAERQSKTTPAGGPSSTGFDARPFLTDPSFQPKVVEGALTDFVVVPLATPQIVRLGNLRLNWLSQAGQAYQVQLKNQVDAPSWSNLDLTIIATSTNTSADIPMTAAAGFYRVIQVP